MPEDYKNTIYRNYHTVHTKKLYGSISTESVKRKFVFWNYYFGEFLTDNKNINILDAGCGIGDFVFWLHSNGFVNAYGIDLSEELIKIGSSLNFINISQQDLIQNLSINSDKYDLIFMRDVLEHFNKEQIFKILQLSNVALKKNGKLVIQVPNGFSPFYGKIFFSDFTHETLFTEASLNQIALSCGFSSVKIKETGPVPHNLISTIRFYFWKIIRLKLIFYQLVESGHPKGFFTQNIIAELRK